MSGAEANKNNRNRMVYEFNKLGVGFKLDFSGMRKLEAVRNLESVRHFAGKTAVYGISLPVSNSYTAFVAVNNPAINGFARLFIPIPHKTD